MPVFGVICEYDPFHLGHRWMLEQLRQQGPVVCAMSGCFTQRGEFAAVNKFARAEMAVRNGADLVLELPTPWAVSGAERFARGGVELLQKAGVVTHLAFGSECGDLEALRRVEACLSGVHIRMPSGSGWRGRNLCPVPAAGGGEAAGAPGCGAAGSAQQHPGH
ncbi:MAG: nucleotidyltransferase family protein [Oscillospiraceae bacterium]